VTSSVPEVPSIASASIRFPGTAAATLAITLAMASHQISASCRSPPPVARGGGNGAEDCATTLPAASIAMPRTPDVPTSTPR